MADDDCIFCKIVAGEIPAQKIDENDQVLAFMDINPWTRGHALVIPKQHTRNLWEAPKETLDSTIEMAQQVAIRQRDNLGCAGVNLLNSTEPAAWQTVFHYHVHVIPRYEDDPLQLPGKPMDVGQDELAKVAEELRG
jgi:histidine triad (HIT) family protein